MNEIKSKRYIVSCLWYGMACICRCYARFVDAYRDYNNPWAIFPPGVENICIDRVTADGEITTIEVQT